ncbi:SCOCO-like protein 1 [Nakaseomyces bracarensis]|uniref:SCOCO-like protein 1 n=1 Tax=Nakaseomyces bracarensis TaxID=273131 RepID=A0ABR4P092_9SACH
MEEVKKVETREEDLRKETKLLKDTLDLLWNRTYEQRKLCDQLEQENENLKDYINNLMSSSNVLDK